MDREAYGGFFKVKLAMKREVTVLVEFVRFPINNLVLEPLATLT